MFTGLLLFSYVIQNHRPSGHTADSEPVPPTSVIKENGYIVMPIDQSDKGSSYDSNLCQNDKEKTNKQEKSRTS